VALEKSLNRHMQMLGCDSRAFDCRRINVSFAYILSKEGHGAQRRAQGGSLGADRARRQPPLRLGRAAPAGGRAQGHPGGRQGAAHGFDRRRGDAARTASRRSPGGGAGSAARAARSGVRHQRGRGRLRRVRGPPEQDLFAPQGDRRGAAAADARGAPHAGGDHGLQPVREHDLRPAPRRRARRRSPRRRGAHAPAGLLHPLGAPGPALRGEPARRAACLPGVREALGLRRLRGDRRGHARVPARLAIGGPPAQDPVRRAEEQSPAVPRLQLPRLAGPLLRPHRRQPAAAAGRRSEVRGRPRGVLRSQTRALPAPVQDRGRALGRCGGVRRGAPPALAGAAAGRGPGGSSPAGRRADGGGRDLHQLRERGPGGGAEPEDGARGRRLRHLVRPGEHPSRRLLGPRDPGQHPALLAVPAAAVAAGGAAAGGLLPARVAVGPRPRAVVRRERALHPADRDRRRGGRDERDPGGVLGPPVQPFPLARPTPEFVERAKEAIRSLRLREAGYP
jgi:hypothetical protein